MRLFISYARVDHIECNRVIQIIQDGHQFWYDKNLFIGQRWWQEIIKQIRRADVFVFLISPSSLKSIYCKKEFVVARNRGKMIIPIIVKKVDKLPRELSEIHTINMTNITPDNVAELLNSLLMIERNKKENLMAVRDYDQNRSDENEPSTPDFDEKTYQKDAHQALLDNDLETALFLIKTAIQQKVPSHIPLHLWQREIEAKLEKQILEQIAQTDYATILALVNQPVTRKLGCESFQNFRKVYPNYDPEGIAQICDRMKYPHLEWVDISAGETTLHLEKKRVVHHVGAFRISKFPITNSHFQMFIDAIDGYEDIKWWDFSDEACQWRTYYKALRPRGRQNKHPRVFVSWYEAMAFCNWMSYKTGLKIRLPSAQEWQRAAQGNDLRLYPWGKRFNPANCNARSSKIHKTTPVDHFENGASQFGVMDMSGNVWEWTQTEDIPQESTIRSSSEATMMIKGGSYSSEAMLVRPTNFIAVKQSSRFGTLGFRVVVEI